MTAGGRKSIMFISHKLGEVLALADRMTVLRRGKVTAAGMPAAGSTRADLARLMVGREVIETVERTPARLGDVVLDVGDVEAVNDRELPALRGASFTSAAARSSGSRRSPATARRELAEVITGLRACTGRIRINGGTSRTPPPAHAIRHGVAHIPEDRTGVGSAPNLSVADNLIMKSYRTPPIAQGWLIDTVRARGVAEAMRERYAIASPSIDTEARLLSGGNLQRLILAREIESEPDLIIAVQPTRGLDVGAIESVHRLLMARRAAGAAILLITEELDEIMSLADRVDVMYEGRIVGSFPVDTADIERIGLLMTGGEDAADRCDCRRR